MRCRRIYILKDAWKYDEESLINLTLIYFSSVTKKLRKDHFPMVRQDAMQSMASLYNEGSFGTITNGIM